jgi:agmatinase
LKKNKQELIKDYDPNGVGQTGTLFGLPYTPETSEVIIIPVPWEVTVSYNSGTATGPEEVLYASSQIDLFDPDVQDAWKLGVTMLEIPEHILDASDSLRDEVEEYIEWLEEGSPEEEGSDELSALPARINEESAKLNVWVKEQAKQVLDQGKIPVVLGGDHSTPLGLMQALAEKYPDGYGILQVDAHADLRDAYEDFEFSHASIMFNALKIPQVKRLIQVGIRDYAESEGSLVENSDGKIISYYDQYIKEAAFEGRTWKHICEEIIEDLPKDVYVSFDIDGLDPKLCPNTGTPVPGGFEFAEAMYLIKAVVKSGRRIIGFDLCEVANSEDSEWDANVGARVLYKMTNLAAVSQGKLVGNFKSK